MGWWGWIAPALVGLIGLVLFVVSHAGEIWRAVVGG